MVGKSTKSTIWTVIKVLFDKYTKSTIFIKVPRVILGKSTKSTFQ